MAIKFFVVLVWMLPQSLLSITAPVGLALSPRVVSRKTLGVGPEWASRLFETMVPKQRLRF